MPPPTPSSSKPPILLFGYASSPFTQKIRLSLRLKHLPYTFIPVPSMMPRPLLVAAFGLTYRKIPVLAIGRDVYADTSIILEALESTFPATSSSSSSGSSHSDSNGKIATLYPRSASGRTNRGLIRGFASFWIDRPFFRLTTGLIPSSVWRTRFGTDRAGLIGHVLDPAKLEAKVPRNLVGLDLHLGLFEGWLVELAEEGESDGSKEKEKEGPWLFDTATPGLGDIVLFYQLEWGLDIARGRGIGDLTGGGTADTDTEGAGAVFNARRYPALWAWFHRAKEYFAALPDVETRLEKGDEEGAVKAVEGLKRWPKRGAEGMIPTPGGAHGELDAKTGLVVGRRMRVSIAPDDTGRDDPTVGVLVGLSPEEVVIEPVKVEGRTPLVDVAVHFPRIGFVVKPVREAKL